MTAGITGLPMELGSPGITGPELPELPVIPGPPVTPPHPMGLPVPAAGPGRVVIRVGSESASGLLPGLGASDHDADQGDSDHGAPAKEYGS